jgi:C-terminal processing protease CtpA/Prc
MLLNYYNIIKQVDKIIQKYGIPEYIKKWKKIEVPDNFNTYDNFIEFVNKYLKIYHSHTFIESKQLYEKINNKEKSLNKFEEKPLPDFKYDNKNKIGTIVFYHLFNSFNSNKDEKDINKINKLVETNINQWQKLGLNGLIIDLRKHIGGNMWPTIESLKMILGNTTLLSFNNVKTKFNEKDWINIKDGQILFEQKFLTNELQFKNPIAILVSNNTASSGEVIGCVFYKRENVKIFGDKTNKTRGKLSVNNTYNINKDISLNLTTGLCTSTDGTFHINEYLSVDVETNSPITDAKKWIIKKTNI